MRVPLFQPSSGIKESMSAPIKNNRILVIRHNCPYKVYKYLTKPHSSHNKTNVRPRNSFISFCYVKLNKNMATNNRFLDLVNDLLSKYDGL